jgi:hypothetical protein
MVRNIIKRAVDACWERQGISVILSTIRNACGPLILMTATPAGIRPDASAAIVSLNSLDRSGWIDFGLHHFAGVVGTTL